ncbi:MAG: PIN domain-containing protein [Acidimicrobiales bacterium]
MTGVLDTGALIAIDKRDRRVGAILRVLQRDGVPICTSAGVVAQVWRDGRRQVNLARVLSGVEIAALDDRGGMRVGELLRTNRSSDVIDAHVALLVRPDARVLTSDDADIQALLRSRRVKAHIVHV